MPKQNYKTYLTDRGTQAELHVRLTELRDTVTKTGRAINWGMDSARAKAIRLGQTIPVSDIPIQLDADQLHDLAGDLRGQVELVIESLGHIVGHNLG